MNAPDARGTDHFTADFRGTFCSTCAEGTGIALALFRERKDRGAKKSVAAAASLVPLTSSHRSAKRHALPFFSSFCFFLTKGVRSCGPTLSENTLKKSSN